MTIQQTIEQRLQTAFQPEYLAVVNESSQHNVPPGSESHFKVTLVANAFAQKRPVARHQMVYAELQSLLSDGLHALALHTFTPEEWSQHPEAPQSPRCRGGQK
jgi:BolA protein